MKSVLLFAILFANTILYSQSVYELTDQFLVDRYGAVHLKHNIELEYSQYSRYPEYSRDTNAFYIETEDWDLVHNHPSGIPKRYYEKSVFKFSEEKKIRVDVIMDTIILLEESFKEEIIRKGKVKIDSTTYSTYKVVFTNSYGEDSLGVDTFFHVIPIDYWFSDLDGVVHEFGTFKNGKKDGLWQTKLILGISHCLEAVLTEQQFDNGKLITEKTIGYHKPNETLIKSLIVKEWFGTGRWLSGQAPLIFSFKTTNQKCGNRYGQFDYLLVNTTTFIEKGSYRCGIGVPKPISGKWSINSEGKLLLDEYLFSVEYISETELLLKN